MKDIKTKEVTTKPKTKNPASRIPKELMRTAILESKEKSQTIANARDNDMGEQSPSEYASGKVTSAEEWAARKTGRTVAVLLSCFLGNFLKRLYGFCVYWVYRYRPFIWQLSIWIILRFKSR